MFGLFKKNSSGMAMVKYAQDIGFLYTNLKEIDNLHGSAENNILCLAAFYTKQIAKNPKMDLLNVSHKCMIPEMYGWKWTSIALSSTEILILLHEKIKKYNLELQFEEIYNMGELYYEYENSCD